LDVVRDGVGLLFAEPLGQQEGEALPRAYASQFL
jgi:hypothetical protein